jgi:anti-sigma B factor antagonist
MDITVVNHPFGVAEVAVVGRLNMVTAARLRESIAQAVDANHPNVTVDLSEVVFLDSSGLGALVAGLKAVRAAGGDLRLIRPGEQAQLVLELTNMGSVLKSFDSVGDAFPDG